MKCPQDFRPANGPYPTIGNGWEEGSKRWNDDAFVRWPEGHAKPRTCGYCGGVHPEDLVVLLKNGWRLGGTDKSYKMYVNPPDSTGMGSAIPPVKFYTYHASKENIDALNAALNA